MNLLLDTHALLWMVGDDARLSTSARETMRRADTLAYSMASFWEIAIKQSLERLDFRLTAHWEALLVDELKANGIGCLGISSGHCSVVSRLPWHHRDPFDRMLVAQASCERMTLLSRDRHLGAYGVPVTW